MRLARLLMIVGGACGVTTLIGYVVLMRHQRDQPAAWYLGMLVAGVGLVAVALSDRSAVVVSFGAAALLVVAGFLGILSVGFPALVGGWLVFAGATLRVTASTADGS